MQQPALDISSMDYQEYRPHTDLDALVKHYWTLEVPAEAETQTQLVIPDGCIEMVFILQGVIKRYTSEDTFIIQPRAFVLGQITKPFVVQPTGRVSSFAVRFYPYGFANLISEPIKNFANKETPLAAVFGAEATNRLTREIMYAVDTKARIEILDHFLLEKLKSNNTVKDLMRTTVDTLFLSRPSIKTVLKNDISKRRQLERQFMNQIGLSPKQLSKIIRLQTALKMMLETQPESLSKIAYKSDYYDQAHFIKDFKEFTGMTPKEFFKDEKMELSSLFYKQ